MSTATVPSPGAHPIGHDVSYLKSQTGIMSWIITMDHKRIGVLYMIWIMAAFLLGGLFAVLLRTELITPQISILGSNENYNKAFTLHGAIMVFLFIIPSVPAILGNFFLPIMIGAKDVAFPRLNLMSFYIYVIGAVFAVYSIVVGAVDTGWTFYTPYSVDTNTSVVSMTLAVFILGFSSIFTGLNFIVTTHKMRAPGMHWFRMPLFAWGIYATAIIQVLATPVLGITLLLLIIERVAHIGIFDPMMGGDPVLFQHFFWFYSHPAVYIMILPGMAIISEIIPHFSRKPIFGYSFIAYSSLAIALISFIVWGHHMFTSGQSEIAIMIFSALTFLVAIPSAIKIFNWTVTLYRGQIKLDTPMLYALAFIFLFTIGGLTGLPLATVGVDVHLHDTYYVVAHFHYVMVGGTVIAFFGGLHYWWPKMFGRMYPEWLGRITCVIIFIGFNLVFIPQFIMGSQGMPRRYATYDAHFQPMHAFSSVGAWVMGLGIVVMYSYFIWSLFKGEKAPKNPWNLKSLEWETESPPIQANFADTPTFFHQPYDYGVEPEKATVKP